MKCRWAIVDASGIGDLRITRGEERFLVHFSFPTPFWVLKMAVLDKPCLLMALTKDSMGTCNGLLCRRDWLNNAEQKKKPLGAPSLVWFTIISYNVGGNQTDILHLYNIHSRQRTQKGPWRQSKQKARSQFFFSLIVGSGLVDVVVQPERKWLENNNRI